jgi:hypothetical protein
VLKQQEPGTGHSPSVTAEIKNMRGALLLLSTCAVYNYRDNLTFTRVPPKKNAEIII